MRWIIAVLMMVGSAQAKLGVDIEWGYMQGKAIFMADANGNMRGGSNWEYVNVSLCSINRDSTMKAYGVVFEGFQANSSVSVLGSVLTLKTKVAIMGVQWQRFFTPPGEASRFFFKAGPVLANIEMDVGANVLGTLSIGEETWKPGFRAGIGLAHRISEKMVILGNMAYTYVNVDGTFDPSLFTATIGVGFGG